jgi:lincosamide nucleotidyltransferase A/C/D/E
VDLLQLMEHHGLEIYVDGGWAVDALMGEQTRPHDDLDIALPHDSVPALRALLATRGFQEVARPDSWECNFVLGDQSGARVDVHSYRLDESGNPIHGIPYRSEHFTGRGSIADYPVRCIAPEWLVQFHTGYEADENDHHDVQLLCQRFGIELPEQYRKSNGS